MHALYYIPAVIKHPLDVFCVNSTGEVWITVVLSLSWGRADTLKQIFTHKYIFKTTNHLFMTKWQQFSRKDTSICIWRGRRCRVNSIIDAIVFVLLHLTSKSYLQCLIVKGINQNQSSGSWSLGLAPTYLSLIIFISLLQFSDRQQYL